MERFLPKRILWPYGPLRVVFSIVAVLSAVALYFASPRFAESPSLFAGAALVLFAAEVSAFEVGVRRLGSSNMWWRRTVTFNMSEELERLGQRVTELAWFMEKSAQHAEGQFQELSSQIQLIGVSDRAAHVAVSSSDEGQKLLSDRLSDVVQYQSRLTEQMQQMARLTEQLKELMSEVLALRQAEPVTDQINILTKEILDLKQTLRAKFSEPENPSQPNVLLGLDLAHYDKLWNDVKTKITQLTPERHFLIGADNPSLPDEGHIIHYFAARGQSINEETNRKLGDLDKRIATLLLQGHSRDFIAQQLGLLQSTVAERLGVIADRLLKGSFVFRHYSEKESMTGVPFLPSTKERIILGKQQGKPKK